MLTAVWKKNDRRASWLIIGFSIIVAGVVAVLSQIQFRFDPGFDVHLFARFNAIVNSMVAILLVVALIAVRKGQYLLHKRLMLTAMILSVLFLISYICHHLLAGETRFGDLNHDGIISEVERATSGNIKYLYIAILLTHIPLAAIILPFVLFTAYRALTGEFPRHKKLARITWPIWLYVAVTGVIVYLMISPYY